MARLSPINSQWPQLTWSIFGFQDTGGGTLRVPHYFLHGNIISQWIKINVLDFVRLALKCSSICTFPHWGCSPLNNHKHHVQTSTSDLHDDVGAELVWSQNKRGGVKRSGGEHSLKRSQREHSKRRRFGGKRRKADIENIRSVIVEEFKVWVMLVLSKLIKPQQELNMRSYFPVSVCEREREQDRERMCMLKETMMASCCAAENCRCSTCV